MRYSLLMVSLIGFPFFLTLAGCAIATDESSSEEAVAQVFEPLAMAPGTYWASPGQIEICFKLPASDVWGPDDDTRSQQVLNVVNKTWGSATGLTFDRFMPGRCTEADIVSAPEVLPVELRHNAVDGWSGACGHGIGTECFFGSNMWWTDDRFSGVANHEVGHALGFGHEHQRANFWDPTVIVGPAGSWEVPLCAEKQAEWDSGVRANLESMPYLYKLTGYDPLSVLNYCNMANGRPIVGYDGADIPSWDLSWKDMVGAEVLYPKSLTVNRFGCSSGCFETGFGVVTRSDGVVTTNLLARGALTSTISGSGVTWKIAGKPDRVAYNLTLSDLASNVKTVVEFTFGDLRGRLLSNSAGSKNVLKSNGYHAAMVGSVAPLL